MAMWKLATSTRRQIQGDDPAPRDGDHFSSPSPSIPFQIPRWGKTLGVALLLALPLLLRFFDLEADPPVNVAFIHAFATDEGYYSYHARSVVLFGETPAADYWDSQRVSPLFDLVLTSSFSLLGVGLRALRLPQVLLGMVTVGIFYALLRQEAGPAVARWGALFLAWNELFFVFNRAGMYHTLLICLCVACSWTWLRGWNRPAWFLLSGALAALAVLTSLFVLLFLASLALASLLWIVARRGRSVPAGIGGALLWLGGFALILGPVLGLFVLPQGNLVLRDLAKSGSFPIYSSPWQVVGNVFLFLYNPFFLFNLLPLLGILLYTGRSLPRWRRKSELRPLEILLLSWFWTGAIALSLVNYRPTRYFLNLLVPMCAALAFVVVRWEDYLGSSRRPSLGVTAPLVVVAALAVRDVLGPNLLPGGPVWWAGLALSWVVALLSASVTGEGRVRRFLPYLGGLLISTYLVTNAAFGLQAWLDRQHTLRSVSRELGQILPLNTLLLRGCTLTLENRLHCLPIIEPEEVDPSAWPNYRLFYLTKYPAEGLPGDRLWGTWHVLDQVVRVYEVAPGRRTLLGLDMGHY